MIPIWTKGNCIQCGEEGYITRTKEKPDGSTYTCGECEKYERGYKDSLKEASKPPKEILWFAAGGGLIKFGPFKSQVEAWKALVLRKKEQEKQQSIHPRDSRVWCEQSDE